MKINLIVKVKIVLKNMHKLKMSNHISEAKFFDCKSILISILSRKEIKKVKKNKKTLK